ncbi:MAG: hypothetical protein B6243_14075 [Anaerolineaceae bacterium 4572_5.2]|nr:MAG: hypothetical protein B6243_14075 [Anaerolineaceae bacterium 4572_5.2]
MYSWNEDTSSWYGAGAYSYGERGADKRKAAAKRAEAGGPRTYKKKSGPNEKIIDPQKHIRSESPNPLSFAGGFDLEQLLGSLYGEGGGGDAPESYGLFAHWVNTHVQAPNAAEPPFLIVFGDAPMHPKVAKQHVAHYLGDQTKRDVDALKAWQQVSQNWNTWFLLRRPTGKPGDKVDKQWGRAIGTQKIFHIQDEQRAVDYAMGLIARAWGRFGDFQNNMRARQDEKTVVSVSEPIEVKCPRCGAPVP